MTTLLGLASLGAPALAAPVNAEQQRAAREMEEVGLAILGWLSDQTTASSNASNNLGDGSPTVDVSSFPFVTFEDLEALLVPLYIDSLPRLDPWGNAYEYRLNVANLFSPFLSAIRSAGADATFEDDVYSYGRVTAPAEDLVWANARFVRAAPVPPGQEQPITVQEIREIGTAIFAWITDILSEGPESASNGDGPFDLSVFVPITHQDLEALLVPVYLQFLPETDPWGRPYEFWLDVDNLLAPQVTAIRSAGADGTTSGNLYTPGSFPASQQGEDIVWSDGFFVRFPEGELPFFRDGFETGAADCWTLSVGAANP